jgi:Histidine kinase-, DNA gyrase B-, and HSP90-like ATPase
MKVAFLLRTADAAHIDGARAPWFLFALKKPEGISEKHWRFQSKLGQPRCKVHGELQISSTQSFDASERDAWWLAFDTVQMIDRELRDAHGFLRDYSRKLFDANAVTGAGSPESFAKYVRPKGWEPLDVVPKIGNVNRIIKLLGGEALYGDHPEFALRELLQNGMDAVRAKRALGGFAETEGEVLVELEKTGNDFLLGVTDNGIGMTKHVIANVLLDFGNSLWLSDEVREVLPGLASGNFDPAGQFGIGFFSVFMLGAKVKVYTTPYRKHTKTENKSHELIFENGLAARPVLHEVPPLPLSGTRVSVSVSDDSICKALSFESRLRNWLSRSYRSQAHASELSKVIDCERLALLILKLAPQSDVRIRVQVGNDEKTVLEPNDWQTVSDPEFEKRTLGSISRKRSFRLLSDDNGKHVGRLAINVARGGFAYDTALSATSNGLFCGEQPYFTGVLAASVPTNAARTESRVVYSKKSWMLWAKDTLDKDIENLSVDNLSALNALLPTEDLFVYERGECFFNTQEIVELLVEETVIYVHIGGFDYSEQDRTVTGDDFGDHFERDENIIVSPRRIELPKLWDTLGLNAIDYLEKLRASLNSSGVRYQESVEEAVVGEVLGTQIVRTAHVLKIESTDAADQ